MLTRAISVVIIDDHPVVRDGVAMQLGPFSDLVVVGTAATASAGIELCGREKPDVILLDLRLPDALAAEVVPKLHAVTPASRILLFTAFPEHAAVAPSLAAGACGLLVKDASGTVLGAALREVARVGRFGSRPTEAVNSPVSPREYDVLRLVAAGCTNIEIGQELCLSPNTVKAYLASVMQKLDSRNRTQVITTARARGLL